MIPIFAKIIQEVYPIQAKDQQSMRSLVVREKWVLDQQYVQKNVAQDTTQTGYTVDNSGKSKYPLRIHWRLSTILKASKKVYEAVIFDL